MEKVQPDIMNWHSTENERVVQTNPYYNYPVWSAINSGVGMAPGELSDRFTKWTNVLLTADNYLQNQYLIIKSAVPTNLNRGNEQYEIYSAYTTDDVDSSILTETDKEVLENIAPILSQFDESMSDIEKAKIMVSTICDRFNYLEDGWFAWSGESRLGDCDAYANVVDTIFNAAGIPTFMQAYPGNDHRAAHAYNYAYMDGEWYVVDATFADTGAAQGVYTPIKEKEYLDYEFNADHGYPSENNMEARILFTLIETVLKENGGKWICGIDY